MRQRIHFNDRFYHLVRGKGQSNNNDFMHGSWRTHQIEYNLSRRLRIGWVSDTRP